MTLTLQRQATSITKSAMVIWPWHILSSRFCFRNTTKSSCIVRGQWCFNIIKYTMTHWCVTRRKRVKMSTVCITVQYCQTSLQQGIVINTKYVEQCSLTECWSHDPWIPLFWRFVLEILKRKFQLFKNIWLNCFQ